METPHSPHKYIIQRCCELREIVSFHFKICKEKKEGTRKEKDGDDKGRPIPSYTCHFSNGYASYPFFINSAQHFGIDVF